MACRAALEAPEIQVAPVTAGSNNGTSTQHRLGIDTEGEDHAVGMVRYACASRPWIKRDYQKAEKDEPAMTAADEFGNIKIDLNKLFEANERRARDATIRVSRI
jgi:hypothetical protein